MMIMIVGTIRPISRRPNSRRLPGNVKRANAYAIIAETITEISVVANATTSEFAK
jgi:hypothetical protein